MSNPDAVRVIRANWRRYRVENPLALRNVATGPLRTVVAAVLALGLTAGLVGIRQRFPRRRSTTRAFDPAKLVAALRRHAPAHDGLTGAGTR